MKKLILLIPILLSGCATSDDYRGYLAAQEAIITAHQSNQKPLVMLEAHEGQQISGLKSLTVYMPTSAPTIQQKAPNEWAGVASQALGIVGTVGGIVAAGNAAAGLAKQVGKASTAGYSHIQAPQANVSTVTTNTTTDASNRSTTDNSIRSITTTDSSNRSVATSTTSTTSSTTLSGSGVIGSGSSTGPIPQ